MTSLTLATSLFVSLTLTAAALAAKDRDDILDQKRELEELQGDVEASRHRLDSLQSAEKSVQERINNYDDRILSDRKVIRRLSGELNQLKQGVAATDSLLTERGVELERRQRRYLGNLRQFYTAAGETNPSLFPRPNEELDLRRQVVYLAALANYESAGIANASMILNQTVVQLDDLTGQRKTISGLKKKRETSYALGASQKRKQQKNLDQLKRKTMAEADRIIMLQQAAEEMATIIARLERQRTVRGQLPEGQTVTAFETLRNQLNPPMVGKVTHSFGHHEDPVTHLKSFSPGITLKGKATAGVYSVASGTVAYTGDLRGYGKFIIINHDNQYYTTYAGLGKFAVSLDQFVPARQRIGTAGSDGTIKFELRNGREPLDPVEWIKFETL